MERLYTIRETAKILRVHPNTLRQWDDEELQCIRVGPQRARRYRESVILEYLRERQAQ